jgi:SPP1 family phage portal protein
VNDIIEQLHVNEAMLTSEMLRDLVEEQRAPRGRGRITKQLESRYDQSKVPIKEKRVANPQKVNEKIPNDFFSDIVDTKQGYMGNEVTVELDPQKYGDAENDVVKRFLTLNDSIDQNSEMVKASGIAGRGYRLLYIPEGRNEIRVKQLPASETVVYTDDSLGESIYAMRYWDITDITYGNAGHKQRQKRTKVEWYDREIVTIYLDDGRGNYAKIGEFPHLFSGVPIIEFLNNEEGLGEAEKVLDLIDAYDTVISATTSEIEQLRLAYLALKGHVGKVDDDTLKKLEQTGILPLASDGDAKFVTKDVSVEGIKVLLDEIRTNIYEFSRGIDLSRDYGGDLRVIGWQVALLNLENSCKVTERKFKRALREQYRMITDKWREWGEADVDYLDMHFTFTRNFPKDIGSEAKILLDLLGSVSRKTAYSLVSFIDDPDDEIEAFEAEREENANLFGIGNADTRFEDESTAGDENDSNE